LLFCPRTYLLFPSEIIKREKGEKISVQCRPSVTVSVRNPSAIQLACKHTC
jgi:hypothetical protein